MTVKKSLVFAIALLCSICIGCASDESSEAVKNQTIHSMNDLMSIVNQKHQDIVKPIIRYEEYVHEFSTDSFKIEEYMVDMSSGYGADFEGEAVLSFAQAEEDIEVLFRALQTTYGAYYYFGGDAAFTTAKNAVLADCAQIPVLSAKVLASLLLKHLQFIQDGHFRIAAEALNKPFVPFFYKEQAFEKWGNTYRSGDGYKEISSVDGYNNLHELFKMSVSDDGNIVYYPVVLEPFGASWDYVPENLTVRYSDGSTQSLRASPFVSYYDNSDTMIDVHYNQGIPVLFVRNMGFDEAKGDELGKAFLAYAERFKDEPVLILDLRSNGGGNGVLPFKWLEEYSEQPVTTNYVSIKYWTEDNMRDYVENTDNPYYVSYETMTEIAGFAPISDKYMKANAQPDSFAANDRLLVILTGKNTGSAAETFVDIAHNVQNTLIIGELTYGMLVSNAYTVIALPNSRTPIQLGSDLALFPDNADYYREFVGFHPDIWTASGDAEEAAVRLIHRGLFLDSIGK